MFSHTSRYFHLESAEYKTKDGKTIVYKKRRFLPRAENMQLLVEVTVDEGDRMDEITARILGDAEQFWRICDANNAMNPFELVKQYGRNIKVPVPEPHG